MTKLTMNFASTRTNNAHHVHFQGRGQAACVRLSTGEWTIASDPPSRPSKRVADEHHDSRS